MFVIRGSKKAKQKCPVKIPIQMECPEFNAKNRTFSDILQPLPHKESYYYQAVASK